MDKPVLPRIYLSPPHMSGEELELVQDAFASNWIAPLGPHVDAFEREAAEYIGVSYAAALVSGTAAIHLALRLIGLQPGGEVLCSTLTFSASANPCCTNMRSPLLSIAARRVGISIRRVCARSWRHAPGQVSCR